MQECHKLRVRKRDTQDYVCEMLSSVRKKRRNPRSCRVLSASGEEPFTSVTIAAARMRSDAGNLLQWSLKKVEKLEQ